MAAPIITDDMTLDAKLAAIDAALAETQTVVVDGREYTVGIDLADPADLTMCTGCQ